MTLSGYFGPLSKPGLKLEKIDFSIISQVIIFSNLYKKQHFSISVAPIFRRLQFEKTYFIKTFGMELSRKRVQKGLISVKRVEGPYSKKKIFEKVCTTDYLNAPK